MGSILFKTIERYVLHELESYALIKSNAIYMGGQLIF